MPNFVIEPARSLQGELTLPGDKSISHRALLFGALCNGTTRILHGLISDDVKRSRAAVEALGVSVRTDKEAWIVESKGLGSFRQPASKLDMGNSGTTTRLLMGILAGCPFESSLFGDDSLSNRPMRRVTEPLQKMGAVITGANGPDKLPLTIRGGKLKGMRHTPSVPSAQVKSALLLAGLSAEGPTTVVEPVPTRDHTERMLSFLGASVERRGGEVTVQPHPKLQAKEIEVPGDISSAAFFMVAGAIVPNSSVTIRRVGLNPTRTGLIEQLRKMGAKVQVMPRPGNNWEPVGDIRVESSGLRGIEVDQALIPGMIDELPILMVAASQAEGETRMEGVGELRVKETDRIRSMVAGLSAMGAAIRSEGDTVIVEGPRQLKGAEVESFGDHRTAMALAVAGLTAQGTTTVRDSEWVTISFPDFEKTLKSLRRS